METSNSMNPVERIQLMDNAAQAVVEILWQALEQSACEKATVEVRVLFSPP